MSREQDRWDAGEASYKAERDETPIGAKTRAYTEAFRDGMRAALTVPRYEANNLAAAMSVAAGDAYLAGYYAELRRLRNYEDLER